MNRILLSNIEKVDGDVLSVGSDGKYAHLFQKQGTLDGACATYSVMMALLILGTISEDDMLGEEYTSRASKQLFRIFCEEHGMHREGQNLYKIQRMLKEGFASEIISKHPSASGKDAVYEIADGIDQDIPAVAHIEYRSGTHHAITIVGYEEENGTIHKLLCLDPSGEEPKGRKRWNAEINVYRKQKYFDLAVSYGEFKVQLHDILIIKKR